MFGTFLWKMCLNNRLQSSGELFCFDVDSDFFDLLMGETKTPPFYDFWIWGRVPEPQNQLFLSLETPGHLQKIKKNHWNLFQRIVFINLLNLSEIQFVDDIRKDGHRIIPKIRLIKS